MTFRNGRLKIVSVILVLLASGTACKKTGDEQPVQGAAPQSSSPMEDRGIGPVAEIKLEALNPQLASAGNGIFKAKCSACHKLQEKYVGPALNGVTSRRRPEWIMNMILNPAEMTQKDPIAKDLLATHFTQMTFQNVTQDDARKILEFFRQNDAKTN